VLCCLQNNTQHEQSESQQVQQVTGGMLCTREHFSHWFIGKGRRGVWVEERSASGHFYFWLTRSLTHQQQQGVAAMAAPR
jgi:hypothetical protein